MWWISWQKAHGVQWCGYVLRKNEHGVLRRVLEFKINGRRGKGDLKKMEKASGRGN